MAKRKTTPESGPTRKEILLSRREREQLRLVYMGLGLVGALIAIVLAVGAVQTYIIEPNSAIAIVDGVEITAGDYRTRVHYERFILDRQLQSILAQQANLGGTNDEQLGQFLAQQYQQLTQQVLQQRSTVDRQALDFMIDDIFVAKEAQNRELTASEAEIDEFINRFLAGQQGGLTSQSASETETARVEASETAALWTPTPTFTPSPTLTTTETISPTATPVDTPTPAPTPTLNVVDEATLSTDYQNWLNTLAEETGLDESEYRNIIGSLVLANKLQDAIGDETPRSAEQANARHILVETEEGAKSALERLEAGEDFADLAGELSTDPGSATNGGELGFVSRGTFVDSIDEAVFTLAIGEVSEPLESQFGWHIVEVLERETRELPPTEYQRSQQQAYSQWLDDARTSAQIEDFWSPDKAPSDPNNPLFQNQPAAPIAPHGG